VEMHLTASLCVVHESVPLPVTLLLLVFRAVLQHQLEEGLCMVLVQGLGHELVDDWGHLETQLQHTLLALQAHVLGPLHEPVQVRLGWGCCAQTCVVGKERP